MPGWGRKTVAPSCAGTIPSQGQSGVLMHVHAQKRPAAALAFMRHGGRVVQQRARFSLHEIFATSHTTAQNLQHSPPSKITP